MQEMAELQVLGDVLSLKFFITWGIISYAVQTPVLVIFRIVLSLSLRAII
jgi:hypothetical protein